MEVVRTSAVTPLVVITANVQRDRNLQQMGNIVKMLMNVLWLMEDANNVVSTPKDPFTVNASLAIRSMRTVARVSLSTRVP